MFFVLLSSQATTLIDYHILCRLSTTFLFFLFRFCDFINHFQATAYLLYHICQPFVNNFFQVIFKSFDFAFHSTPSIIPPGLSGISCFALAVSATKIILPSRFRIVNVFLVFYLFRTIQTISPISYCCKKISSSISVNSFLNI